MEGGDPLRPGLGAAQIFGKMLAIDAVPLRLAARVWEEDYYGRKLGALGMQHRTAAPTCFFHEPSWTHALVDGDDFVAAVENGHQRVKNRLRQWNDIEVRVILGAGEADDDKDIIVLGLRIER